MHEFNEWLEKAYSDFDAALLLIREKKFEQGAFFLQQSSEKALKAIYLKREKKLIKTHDLILLARNVKAPKNISDNCKKLTQLYQATRYPDVPSSKEIEANISELIELAQEVVQWAKSQ